MATLRMTFGNGDVVSTDRFNFPRAPRPRLSRGIGRLVGGENIVARYADPVWDMRVRAGPLPRVDTARFRAHIGELFTLQVQIPERPRADYPSAEIWINSDITARLLDATPALLGEDVSRGDVWTLRIQFRTSGIA